MAAVTIRNLPDEVHRALKLRAAHHNRSAEAEIRAILEETVRPEERMKLGSALVNIAQKHGVTDADIAALQAMHNRTPAKPMSFE